MVVRAIKKPIIEQIATAQNDITRNYLGKILLNPDKVLSAEAKGKGGHDDGPDAVEQLKSMIETRVGPIEFKSTGKRVGSEMGSYMPTGEAVNY